tara:strand:+ start:68 stop:1597 length:1530 start_codon:yes stop_codon:yes gene_type:complete
MRTDTLRKQLANNMANIVVNRLPETFIDIAPDINLTWTDRLYPGGVWAVDVGTLDVLKDNPEAQAWFKRTFKDKKPSSLRVAKAYVEHLLDDVLPEGATYHIKGHAIQSQNKPGTEFGKGATGATKNELYQKWWGNKKGMQVLPDGSLMYQGHDIGTPVTRPPTSGAPNEYIEALSKEDWRMRKRLSPNSRIKNQYGEQWGLPKEKWWKVEGAGEGVEGRLKTKGLAYDNFKSGIRRAGVKGKTLTMSPWEWDAVYEAYKYAQKHGYHVDHIDPISKTGYHVWDNLQVLDAQDNLIKSAKTDIEGIIPKRSTYLTQGPLTEQDWVKYTKKNRALKASKITNQHLNISPETARGIGIDDGVRNLRTYDPTNPIDLDWVAKEEAFLSKPGRETLKAASEASGGLKNALRKAGSIVPFVGAGLDAWDVQQRYQEMMNNPNEGFTDWLDKAQFGIASATLGTSFWAEPANFVLGMSNLGIDVMRTIFERDKRDDFGDMMQGVARGIGHVGRLF